MVKKPHTTSKVWTHFGLKGDENGTSVHMKIDKPICRHCHKSVLAKQSNTSNLFLHLQDNQPEIHAELTAQRPTNQPTIGKAIQRGKW